jgi:hypothetical protein
LCFIGLEESGRADKAVVEGLVRNVALGRGAPTRGNVWGARARLEHMWAAKEGATLARPRLVPLLLYFGPVIRDHLTPIAASLRT